MTILDNSAKTAFAVWAVDDSGPDQLCAVFESEEDAIKDATSCNQEDDEHDYRVAPVTFTPVGKKSVLNFEDQTSTRDVGEVSDLVSMLEAEHYYASCWPDARADATSGAGEALNGLDLYTTFLKKAYGLEPTPTQQMGDGGPQF